MAAVPPQAPQRNQERVPEATHLACDVVIDSFGRDSGLVASFLLQRGNRTARELCRDTVWVSKCRAILVSQSVARRHPTCH
jgi:hypothetical protein|mmetsp:Transcript_4296/g.14307  ORF Transcript_4296/g.14307 Transcript_4296/m.14307 type:complete len:81 (+) Transcript_4296:59-301(+)